MCEVAPPTSGMNDDQPFFLRLPGVLQCRPAGVAKQFLDHAFDHLHHVEFAFAQVGVVELLELLDQVLHLLNERPFGVAAPLADDVARLLGQFRVFQEHGVDVDEGVELGWRVLGVLLHQDQFVLDHLDGSVEAFDFLVDHARGDGQVRHLKGRMRHQHGSPDGDAAGNPQAV